MSGSGSSYDVVGIGHAIVDVLARVADDEIVRCGLTKGTMSLVDLDRAQAICSALGPATQLSGGSAGNTVVGLAELGSRVAFHARVGDDELGRTFTHDLRAAGVAFDPRGGPADGSLGTGRCLVLVTGDAERTMATYLGAASHLRRDDLDVSELGAARVVYVEGYLWDVPSTKDTLQDAMDATRGGGGKVAMSLSDPFCVERHREEMRALVEGSVDIVFGNELEITLLYGTPSFAEAIAAAGRSAAAITAVTRGPAGSVVVWDGTAIEVPAAPVASVVDTTGAGDLYAAGFLHGVVEGLGPESCARLGALCAAEVISHLGARPQIPLRLLAEKAGLLGASPGG